MSVSIKHPTMNNDADFFATSKFVKELKGSDFDSVSTWKLKDKGCAMVLYYCAWCPHCQAVKDEWEKFGEIATFMKVYALNCEKQRGHLEKIKYDMPELVRGYPTIIIYKNGEPQEHYAGQRTSADFLKRSMCICRGECGVNTSKKKMMPPVAEGGCGRIL